LPQLTVSPGVNSEQPTTSRYTSGPFASTRKSTVAVVPWRGQTSRRLTIRKAWSQRVKARSVDSIAAPTAASTRSVSASWFMKEVEAKLDEVMRRVGSRAA
jgi:hypothetical protein